jgi:hypothetical protein
MRSFSEYYPAINIVEYLKLYILLKVCIASINKEKAAYLQPCI